jgi:hypothetical protein
MAHSQLMLGTNAVAPESLGEASMSELTTNPTTATGKELQVAEGASTALSCDTNLCDATTVARRQVASRLGQDRPGGAYAVPVAGGRRVGLVRQRPASSGSSAAPQMRPRWAGVGPVAPGTVAGGAPSKLLDEPERGI